MAPDTSEQRTQYVAPRIASVPALLAILEDVTYPGYRFKTGVMSDGYFIQVEYDEPCVDTGQMKEQRGRKWYVSSHATRGEVVQTVLKAVLTSAEHRVREHFTYRGRRVFGPHFDLDQLVALCDANATERRASHTPAVATGKEEMR